MQRSKIPILIGGALLLYALYAGLQNQPLAKPDSVPASKPAPKKPAPAKPKNPHCPNCPQFVAEQKPAPRSNAVQLGGIDSPDGTAHILPLPSDIQWPKNIASKGLGCCGFRSLDYAARWQNVPCLVDLPEQMVKAGIAGGAYPEKMDKIVQRFGPEVSYFQDTSKSHALLSACLKSQRIACIDYSGHDPHYSSGIAHCVCVVCFDEQADWVGILDNNYPSLDEIVWMSVAELDKRWGGWAYGLLAVTPGYCPGSCQHYDGAFKADDSGLLNYGLETDKIPVLQSSVLDGAPSDTNAIIAAIGPEMKPIQVDVDHKVSPFVLDFSPHTLALCGGGVLLAYLLLRKEDEIPL